MNAQERIQQQLGALLLANIQLAAENEALRARIAEMMPKDVSTSMTAPEPYPDKTQGSMS